MKRKAITKLSLDRETLRRLEGAALTKVAGAGPTMLVTCMGYSFCTPCIDPQP